MILIDAAIARIADPVAIPVRLIGIGCARAIVGRTGVQREALIAESIPIRVGAGIAGVANAIGVGVGLVPVGQ